LRQYLHEPIAAISPAVVAELPPVGIILAPYVEKGNGKSGDCISFERPAEARYLPFARADISGLLVLAFSTREVEMADYHYHLYNSLAATVAERWSDEVQERFHRLVREELGAEVHGEVDEKSWHLKQA